MNLLIFQLAFENPLTPLFGWLTRILYDFFGNYGLAIIFLTIIIRGVLIPLNVSSQRSTIKNQALSAKINEINRKYPNPADKKKKEEEIVALQQENGALSVSGCLLPILQLVFIWPIYRIVSAPLRHIGQVSVANITAMMELAGLKSSTAATNHINLIQELSSNSDLLNECISKGYIKMEQFIDLDFLGMDLSKIPSIFPNVIANDPKTYLPLLIIPILVVGTSVLSMWLSTSLRPGYKESKEAKARAKKNLGAGKEQEDQTEKMTKAMLWTMPVIMLVTTFSMPAAMGLYWVIGGIMGIITQFVTYFLFTKPYDNKKKELEALKKNAFKKGDIITPVDERKDNKKKKKSILKKDDEE